MKKLIFLLCIIFGWEASAQKEVVKSVDDVVKAVEDTTRTSGWTKKGNISFLFNQSTFNNWVAGGEDNISGNLGVNYDFNYKRKDISWDNKVIASYGLVKTKNSEFEKKTDDRFEFNSLAGKKAKGYWYYSAFLNFRTQFTKGFAYSNVDGVEVRTENTNLLSPGYLTFGPGMMWKKRDDFKFNLAPLSSKLTIVDKDYTSVPGYVDGSYFGVDANKSIRYELGFYAAGYYKFKLFENVTAENIMSVYSNYLEDPQNVDIDYQLNVVMKINKFLSTNISFQTIYDDNAFRGFQTRQVLGVAVNYVF
ncbi:DUF3078 domain-containing protein [Flavobacterium filum]|uniref:DUF3078 domain-containing protein n=1 Tax=Flavobacterium TaxID=237 RepID=UPI00041C37DF|nr:DUF3078 domain-containing protein [Flavobacterium filum]MBN8565159.1 DUF3078 domain-containing protein [Flavobacteriales bacterium]